MDPDAPNVLAGYALMERIGAGGMGEVWRAERQGAGNVRRRVAVKRILAAYRSDRVLLERFVAEARITARLEHPNVVQLVDFGDDPEPYLVLEYIEGISLTDLLEATVHSPGLLSVPAAIYIAAEVAVGLDYAHRRTDENGHALDIVHRDVSPGNILLSLDGAVKIGDFGVARAADNIMRTSAGVAVGKLNYMAPEQAAGGVIDHRADLFSLGIVLWESLVHRPLIPRNNMMAALAQLNACSFPAPSTLVRDVPPELDALVTQALAADPALRPSSGARVSSVLRTILSRVAPGFGPDDLARIVRTSAPERSSRASPKSLTLAIEQVSAGSHASSFSPVQPAPRGSLPPALATATSPGRAGRGRVALVSVIALLGVAAAVAGGVWLEQQRETSGPPTRGPSVVAAPAAVAPAISAPAIAAPVPMPAACAALDACCRAVDADPTLAASACGSMSYLVRIRDGDQCSRALGSLRQGLAADPARAPPSCMTRLTSAPSGQSCARLAPCCAALDALPLGPSAARFRAACDSAVRGVRGSRSADATDRTCRTVAVEVQMLPAVDPTMPTLPAACQ